jgi:hypothetical protein
MVSSLGGLAIFSTWLKSRSRKVSGSWSMVVGGGVVGEQAVRSDRQR